MGLFKSKKQKALEGALIEYATSRKEGYFNCCNCGRTQKITYHGSNDTWTCPSCRVKNRCV